LLFVWTNKLQDAKSPESNEQELEQLEVICNPNAHTSIVDAKALISLRTCGGMRITSEARIPALQADLDAFLSTQ
jgi:hypothetical protein